MWRVGKRRVAATRFGVFFTVTTLSPRRLSSNLMFRKQRRVSRVMSQEIAETFYYASLSRPYDESNIIADQGTFGIGILEQQGGLYNALYSIGSRDRSAALGQ